MAIPDDFPAFLDAFLAAAVARDEAFARKTLPPGLPDDHFGFLLAMRASMAETIAEQRIQPVLKEAGGVVTATYTWKEDDGMTTMDLPFYPHDGSWVSYDPNDPDLA